MYKLKEVKDLDRDKLITKLKCPGCGQWGEIDDEQLQGHVSIDCPDCEFHETIDFTSVAVVYESKWEPTGGN